MTVASSVPSGKCNSAFSFFPGHCECMRALRYMLRYLKGVQMIKQIIEANNLQVMATIARYACAYEAIAKPDWWDKSKRYCYLLSS